MWRNFFNVAIRNIRKNGLFSLINIAGLAMGLASSILIILFIARELSFDRFHEHKDRMYRLYVNGELGDQRFRGAWTAYTMAPTFTREIEEIEAFVRIEVLSQQLVWNGDVRVIEDNIVYADSSFFEIFSIDLIHGNPSTVLNEPNTIVLTRSKALQYFGRENVLGETLEFNEVNNHYLVTGVMEEFPENSHFFCDMMISMTGNPDRNLDDWFYNSINSYILLKKGANFREVERDVNKRLFFHIREQLQSVLGISLEEYLKAGNVYGVFLQPMLDIHLNPEIEAGADTCFRPVNDRSYIYIFASIAFFILVIASINFMNLSTARSSVRAHEIGMRKAMGSDRKTLIRQFLTESVILSLFALILALFIVEISIPWFNKFMQINLSFGSIGNGWILFFVVILALLVGFLSGIYPAFYLSAFDIMKSIRGGREDKRRTSIFRSLMVVMQFTISVAIIVGTMIVSKQANYLLKKDLGFSDDRIIVLDRVHPLGSKIQTFCEELEKIPGIKETSNSTTYLGFSNMISAYQIKGRDRSQNFIFDVNYVDTDFFETYGLKLKDEKGRFFRESYPADSMSVLINEAAVREYGLKDPLNSHIQNIVSEDLVLDYKVIGVLEDFHHSSLRKRISPYIFFLKTAQIESSGFISICFSNTNDYNLPVLKKVNQLWNKFTGDQPMQYFFLDEELNNYYREEERTGKLSTLFSVLAMMIACLGLFGLTMFNAQQRTREIGIRKVMGANIIDILNIISRDTVLMLGMSIVIAWIISFLFMQNWLKVFPYNIGFTPWIYLAAAVLAILIALGTVAGLALRAARSNPAESLHHE